jgi:penicillin-insensitive murein endopeptidase
LVQALIRAAAAVESSAPGSTLVINDVGYAAGGPIVQHGSHQAGRDVDVLFYALDQQRNPMPAVGVPLEPNGRGWDFKDLADPTDDVRVVIDLARTWRFIQALLAVDGDHVQRIFIAEHIRTLLLQQAAKVRAPRRVVQRFEEITCQPSAPHDDHMHVRFFCSADDIAAGCYDTYPMYPWRSSWLRRNGSRPAMVGAWPEYQTRMQQRRQAADARTTSNEEEHAQNRLAGAGWHVRVKQFLERRKAWEDEPHPGRTYCR